MLKLSDRIGITNILSDLKTKKIWTLSEQKILLLIMQKLNPYMKMISKTDFGQLKFYDINIEQLPTTFKFNRTDLIKIGFEPKHFARKIDEVTDLLLDKKIRTSHPEVMGCHESFAKANWFTGAFYNKKNQEVDIEVHPLALKMLSYFFKYSYIKIQNIADIKNVYALNIYIAIKIEIDSRRKSNIRSYDIYIDDFRHAFNIENKYKSIHMLKSRILDSVVREISKYTDILLSYELIKEGRSFTKIKFTFDYKPVHIDKKIKSEVKKIKEPTTIENTATDDYDSPFEKLLVGWNIRARKVVEIEDTYSLEVIQQAIDLTLEKEKAGEIKTTKAAIFLGILENKQLASDEQFERAKIEIEQQQEKQFKEQVSAEYDKLSSFILSNQDLIQSALTSNTKHLPITNKDAIPVLKKIKSIDADKFRAYTVPILSFYHFESNSNVSSTLSDIIDRSQYIEIKTYKDDMAIVQSYKEALDKIKENEYITDEQKDVLRKEVQETINILLGL